MRRGFFVLLALPAILPAQSYTPSIVGEPWSIATSPDLGALSTRHQQVVDFAIWQAGDGSWQLWSCIRNTAEPGKTRLFYRWQRRDLTSADWTAGGIAMRADPRLGETPGGLQAPFVVRDQGRYVMFYGDWARICSQQSTDGITFKRRLNADGTPALFGDASDNNTRDPMLLRVKDRWICYYSANPDRRDAVYARTSVDLTHWDGEREVAPPGVNARDSRYAAECPFVVEPFPGEFYLFETQGYGRFAHTTVRYSADPLDFHGDNVVCTLPIAAPEIVRHDGHWFIAYLRHDLKGIQVARLEWRPSHSEGHSAQ